MSGRDTILGRVRAAVAHRAPHPGPHPPTAGDASTARFAAALERAGGETLGPLPSGSLGPTLVERVRTWGNRGRVVAEASAARLLGPGPWQPVAPDAPPASFADVSVAIVEGALGVAEDGSVAVPARLAPHRSLLVLSERLVLLVYAARIVSDLHAAFRALPADALESNHLTWIAGPSKSADIEQTLVLGAHGPRAHTVVLHQET